VAHDVKSTQPHLQARISDSEPAHPDTQSIAMSTTVIRPAQITASALLALHAAHPQRYPALFESAATGTALGRFDVLFAHPQAQLTLRGDGSLTHPDGSSSRAAFLASLDAWWRELRVTQSTSALPFQGGWLVYLGYELAGEIEPRLRLRPPRSGVIASAVRVPAAVIFDHDAQCAWLVAEPEFADVLGQIESDLAQLEPTQPHSTPSLAATIEDEDPARYLHIVQRALDYIAQGDIYQANLSRLWQGRLQPGVQPHDVFRRLRSTNPGPFCALAVFDGFAIASSSPERLVRVHDGWISTRPIAGTRPRGADTEADRALAAELHGNHKERAEHVMLIDLERNDLGRVCRAGTVEVDEYMTIESYAHVHHIVSNVRGRLRDDVGPGQAIAAVFPGGTITGCPKVRCMEIIAQLEDTARSAYTGSLGYLNRDGSMDFNILIRSLEIRGDSFELRAGAGIVADSVPERELEESRAKARGVLRALE
jgi:anthranilate synthase component 1